MRILVITNLFHPDRGGGASVFSDLCLGLARMGWEVDVFSTHPYYPEWRRKVKARLLRIDFERLNGVKVWRHGLYVPSKPSRLSSRLCYELSFFLSLIRSTRRGGRYDVVMVYCPLLGAVLFAAVRKLLFHEPLWLNIQDIPADAAAGSGISKSRLFHRAASIAQRFLFNRADAWSTISPVMLERLQELRDRAQPLYLCPNWLNGSLAECIRRFESKFGRPLNDPVRLLYAGTIGKKQDLLKFCRVLAQTDLSFELRIYGDGGEARAVQQWIHEDQDRRFLFGNFLEEEAFTAALNRADLFVITEKQGAGSSFIPSKLIPCIATGTPVLAVCDKKGPLGWEVSRSSLGLQCDWENLKSLEAQLVTLIHDSEQLRRYQANCLKQAQECTREFAIPRFARLLQDLTIPHRKSFSPSSRKPIARVGEA